MCKVNFVSEFNLFMRYARNNNLSLRERMLWLALFYVANDRAVYNEQAKEYDWPDDFIYISNGELNLYCCLDKRAIETLRNTLKQRGLIDFIPGVKNKRNPAYRLNYLSVGVGYKNVPNDVPNNDPNNVSNDVPNNGPRDAPSPSPLPKYRYQEDKSGKNHQRSDEDTATTTDDPPEDDTQGDTPLHYRDYTNNPLLTQERARELNVDERQIGTAFPPRTRPMDASERRSLLSIRAFLEGNQEARRLFAERHKVLESVLASDRFPMELVGEALSMTVIRDGRYALDNPMAYALHLLFDWEEREIRSISELRDSKDDWWDRGYTEAL